MNANRVVSVDRLADDLYAGAAPVTALKQVQRQISDLRKVLGSMSVIETRSLCGGSECGTALRYESGTADQA